MEYARSSQATIPRLSRLHSLVQQHWSISLVPEGTDTPTESGRCYYWWKWNGHTSNSTFGQNVKTIYFFEGITWHGINMTYTVHAAHAESAAIKKNKVLKS